MPAEQRGFRPYCPKVVRATRFYAMLLQRLKNHKTMDDGVAWSAQADFVARLADWDAADDPLWPVQHAERFALLTLNVPHFVSATDGDELKDEAGFRMRMPSTDGLTRASARFAHLDRDEIDWQVKVVKINTNSLVAAARHRHRLRGGRCRNCAGRRLRI